MLLDISSSYGYRPSRALAALVALAVLGSIIFNGDRDSFAAIRDSKYRLHSGASGLPPGYPEFNAVLYSIDTMLPFVSLGQKDCWAPTTNSKTMAAWIYKPIHLVIGWFFATIFLGAVTGIIRKE
jgi:hypothetical protein